MTLIEQYKAVKRLNQIVEDIVQTEHALTYWRRELQVARDLRIAYGVAIQQSLEKQLSRHVRMKQKKLDTMLLQLIELVVDRDLDISWGRDVQPRLDRAREQVGEEMRAA